MADNWVSYLCRVNDKLASIFLNLGIRDDTARVNEFETSGHGV